MWVCVQAHAPAPKGSLNRLAKMLCAASLTARRWISKLAVLSFLFTSTAEHCIQQAPFKSMAVAAGVGLLTGVVTTWLMRERRH
jgi:ElaB/YqjD/DUF883 family membrane-anchored ribosome-binding protein